MLRWAWAVLAMGLVPQGACLGPPPVAPPPAGPGLGETTFDISGDQVPPVPDDFTPPPRLPDPLPGDPRLFGAAYLEQVAERISPRFSGFLDDLRVRLPPHHPMNDKTLRARLEFVIDADGQPTDAVLALSSGLEDFDAAAREILLDAAPLPAPPAEVAGDDGIVRVRWLFARDARAAGVATARLMPIRWPTEKAVPTLLERGAYAAAASRLATDESLLEEIRRPLVARTAQAITAAAAAQGDPDAIEAIGAKDAQAIAPRLRKLAATEGSRARAAALLALGSIVDSELAGLARRAVQDTKTPKPVVVAAARAWYRLGVAARAEVAQGASELFEAADPLRRRQAFVIASAVPLDVALQPATEMLEVADALPLVAPAIARLAKAGNRKALALISKQLGSRVAGTRAAFAVALASVGGPLPRRLRSRVERSVSDADERVRVAALQTLAAAWPSRVGRMAAKLRREKSPLVRLALAQALAFDSSRTATKALTAMLNDSDQVVHVAAARGLWGRAQARKLLASLAQSENESLRAAAFPGMSDTALATLLESEGERAILALEARLSLILDSRAAATVIAGQPPRGQLAASLTWLAAEKRANLDR